ncbi:MAG TPA: hypothetical protein VK846_14695 [Candidatus Limnocylindria bacterium]|nr:hypothetical protein [Candidatus Limnocylindria bacterium]
MKSIWFLLVAFLVSLPAHGQGSVGFANTSTTRLYTNDSSGNFGLMSGFHAYRIGLYVGPFGGGESSLQMVGMTTNATVFDGRFNGGFPFSLPNGYPAGTPIAFQVRVWSFLAGMTWEEASTYGGPAFLGQTALGYITPSTGPEPVPALFGSNPGQLSGLQFPPSAPLAAALFIEIEPVPEPSICALAALGVLLALVCNRTRKPS